MKASTAILISSLVLSARAQERPPQAETGMSRPQQQANAELQTLRMHLAQDQHILQDWANLGRYRADNGKLGPPAPGENRVVFMGDSITDAWGRTHGKFFPGKPYVNRGISGQTTPQMLVRFRPDVIDLKPKVVVILAGTNDLAGNTGPETVDQIEGNLASMAQLAQANHILGILASVTPVCDCFRPQTARRPPGQIVALNGWIKNYCDRNGFIYLDYYSAMVDDHEMLKKDLTLDGLHPNDAGYEIMSRLASAAIAQALAKQ